MAKMRNEGPVSALPRHSKCRSMTHPRTPKMAAQSRQCSHLALEMAAWACPGSGGAPSRVVWPCFGVARALKMAAQSRQCNHLALEMVAWARPGSGGAPSRAVWACFGIARALKMAAQSHRCARKGCFRVLTNCCLPACPVGLPGCHLHLPACHSATL